MQAKVDLDRIRVPTRVIVHRSVLSSAALADAIERGELAPREGGICELEAGEKVIARGTVVRRRGESWFKVLETAREEKA